MNAAIDEVKRHLLSRADYHRTVEAGVLSKDDRVELTEADIFETQGRLVPRAFPDIELDVGVLC